MGLIFEEAFDNEATLLGVWKIDESIEDLFSLLMMKSSEMKMLSEFKHEKRKVQWLSVRALIRTLLGNPSRPLEISYDENAKPSLVKSRYHVSISHSKDKAAVLLSEKKFLGIDIEHIHPKIERVIHKFMSPEDIEQADTTHLIEYYHIFWCAKEALYKLNGRSGVDFIRDIKIQAFRYKGSGVIRGEIFFDQKWNAYQLHYQKINEYMLVYVY